MNQLTDERQPEPQGIDAGQKSVSLGPGLRDLQEKLLDGLLRAAAIVGFLVAGAGSVESYLAGELWTIPFYLGAYGLVLLFLFWRAAPYELRAWALIALVFVMGVIDFLQDGPSGSARTFMLTMPFLAAILLGRGQSIFALLLSSLTMLGFGLAFYTGLVSIADDSASTNLASWIAGSLVVFMLGSMMAVSLNYLGPRLAGALAQSRRLARELGQERIHLEELVAERTEALARRSTQLETAAQVSRDATAIQDVDRLLKETVHLISTRFGFYHTGIFLLDEAREYAVLRAASSEGGRRMLARGHRLRVGESGIVGFVTRQGDPRIALDVGEDAAYFDNPDLPATRSEVALPLRVRSEIIGALDVQSTEPAAFDQDDVTVLQTLADQVAVAINNAQLFQQVQESLEAERRAYGELSREAWQDLLRAQATAGRRYDPQDILPADGRWREEMVQAAQKGEPVYGDGEALGMLAVPLTVRDQVVGVLDAHKPDGEREWTAEEVELLQTLVDQLGVALESARLYQDTQRRAAQERLVGEVTTRMRETLDIETVLQTAVREMRDALGMAEVEVNLDIPDGS